MIQSVGIVEINVVQKGAGKLAVGFIKLIWQKYEWNFLSLIPES
jgi:hypothetical protein